MSLINSATRHRLLVSLLLLIGLSGCGWQLRGTGPLHTTQNPELQSNNSNASVVTSEINLEDENKPGDSVPITTSTTPPNDRQPTPETTSSTAVERNTVDLAFISSSPGIETALLWVMEQQQLKLADKAARKVIIYRERTEKRPLVYSETGVPLRYQLIMNVDYAVEDHNGKLIVPRRNIMRWRNYDFDATQIAATVQEEKILRSELSGELARQIITAQ